MNTAFYSVFDEKLKRIKKNIKHEFDKESQKRNKNLIKRLIQEAKELRQLLKDMENEHKRKRKAIECKCPKCGHKFEV